MKSRTHPFMLRSVRFSTSLRYVAGGMFFFIILTGTSRAVAAEEPELSTPPRSALSQPPQSQLTPPRTGTLLPSPELTSSETADNAPLLSGSEPPPSSERIIRMASKADSVLVRLNGSESHDPEGRPLKYQWTQVGGPRMVLSDATSPAPFFRTRIPGLYQFTLTVSDGERTSAPATVNVRVALPNFPPEAIVPMDIVTSAGKSIAIDGSKSRDMNGDTLSYFWKQRSGPPLYLDPEKDTASQLTLKDLHAGAYEIELIVSDGTVLSRPALCRLRVTEENRTPIAVAGTDQRIELHVAPELTIMNVSADAPVAVTKPEVVATVGEPITLDGSESYSPKRKPLRFFWQQREGPFIRDYSIPDGDLAKISFTPEAAGELTFSLIVNDGELDSVPQLVTVHIVAGNAPPVAVIEAATEGTVGTPIALDASKSYDREGMPLTYTWRRIAGPRVTSVGFSSTKNPAKPVFIPSLPGTYTFELVVSDGQKQSAGATHTISVTDDNLPPTIRIVPIQKTAVGERFSLTASGFDPEGMPLWYEWSQLSGPEKLLERIARQQSITLSAIREGAYVFQARCSDGKKSSPVASVTVTVSKNVNQSPRIVTALSLHGMEMEPMTLDASASTDPEGTPLNWHWSLEPDSPASHCRFTPHADGKTTFLPQEPGIFLIHLRVSDGDRASEAQIRVDVSRSISPE